jgi:hypothetical protein
VVLHRLLHKFGSFESIRSDQCLSEAQDGPSLRAPQGGSAIRRLPRDRFFNKAQIGVTEDTFRQRAGF